MRRGKRRVCREVSRDDITAVLAWLEQAQLAPWARRVVTLALALAVALTLALALALAPTLTTTLALALALAPTLTTTLALALALALTLALTCVGEASHGFAHRLDAVASKGAPPGQGWGSG
jgi:F0F1-type ATP synthase membrane subunit a